MSKEIPEWLLESEKECEKLRVFCDLSAHAQDKALERLLKDSVRECQYCHGLGRHVGKDYDSCCIMCGSNAYVCAWCRKSEYHCECGGE